MGYYIETDSNKNKADWLVKNARGIQTSDPTTPPKGFVPVIVMNNGPFEAAGIAFDEQELADFIYPDGRQKKYVFVPREEVLRLQPLVEDLLKWPVS